MHTKLYSTSDENWQRNVGGEKATKFEGRIDTKFRKEKRIVIKIWSDCLVNLILANKTQYNTIQYNTKQKLKPEEISWTESK